MNDAMRAIAARQTMSRATAARGTAPQPAPAPPPAPAAAPARYAETEPLRVLAGALLQAKLRAEGVGRKVTEGTRGQQELLDAHIDRMTDLLAGQCQAPKTDLAAVRAVEAGTEAAGLAADLMYLDQVGVAAGQPTAGIARRGSNRGLAWAWSAMRKLETDPAWALTKPAEVTEALGNARFHRDSIEDLMRNAVLVKAGASAAQTADLIVSAPHLIASGVGGLRRLAQWLTEGGGTGGLHFAVSGGTWAFAVVSGGRTLVLSAEEVAALVKAGVIPAEAASLYLMAKGGGGQVAAGPYGARPPGSESRYSDAELLKDYLQEIGKRVPADAQAAQALGDLPKKLRMVEFEHHHLLVRQLRRWFQEAGLDIDRYVVKLRPDEHRWVHNEYDWNQLWIDFRRTNPGAEAEEILTKMREFQRRFGLEDLEILPYPRHGR